MFSVENAPMIAFELPHLLSPLDLPIAPGFEAALLTVFPLLPMLALFVAMCFLAPKHRL